MTPLQIAILVLVIAAAAGILFLLRGRTKTQSAPAGASPLSSGDFAAAARAILDGVGGPGNIVSHSHCVSRLRIKLKDGTLVNEKKLYAVGAAGIMRPDRETVQVVIGAKTADVAAAFAQLL